MRRVLVAAGPSPLRGAFSDVPVDRMTNGVLDPPKTRTGCGMASLAILGCLGAIAFSALYLLGHIVWVVWS